VKVKSEFEMSARGLSHFASAVLYTAYSNEFTCAAHGA